LEVFKCGSASPTISSAKDHEPASLKQEQSAKRADNGI
jgi:hypothetical protein